MPSPTVDIIVPVWNNLFETRACLVALLTHSPEARLIVIDNGSDRDTQVMLEEFSEPLGERALFMASERNLGLVPAINRGLARSDSDFAVVIRPHVQVVPGWLTGLLEAARDPDIGIVSPLFTGSGAPQFPPPARGCLRMETFAGSFSALLIKREMRLQLSGFDEALDGGEWCLKDYLRQAWDKGFRTCVTANPTVMCGAETVFGSEIRRRDQTRISQECYRKRWGAGRHYAVYFGSAAIAGSLTDAVETIVNGARRGHRFTLLLHRRQASDFRRMGWNGLHSGIEIRTLSILGPQRDLNRKLTALQVAVPDIIPVQGADGVPFPGAETALPVCDLTTVP